MVGRFTRSKIKQRINDELPIITLFNYLVENNLIHPNAITNQKILDGEITLHPIDVDEIDYEKDKSVPYYCFFHDTLNTDSTNFVLSLGDRAVGTNDKKEKASNYYRCFGCDHGKSLFPIDLYMVLRFGVKPRLLKIFEEHKKEYYQSIAELSKLMGITYDDNKRIISDEEKAAYRIQLVLKRTTEHYHQFLKSKDSFAKRSLAYLFKERGFTHIGNDFFKIIDELKIGCAPKKYNSTFLYDKLKAEGFTDEEMLAAGVVYKFDNGKIIDFHQNGIILPYIYQGKIHNIYCRRFTTEKKRRHMKLAGGIEYPVNLEKACKYPSLIFVEGEMDFITFKALGFENVVCVGGTKGFTDEHLNQILYQYDISDGENCKTIYICLDGDEKGQTAVREVAEMLEAEGCFDVRIVRMRTTNKETGEFIEGDPNEFLQTFGLGAKDVLQQLVDEALSYPAFQFVTACEKEDVGKLTRTAQLGFIRRHQKTLAEVTPLEKMFLALEVAGYFHVDESWIIHAWSMTPAKKVEDKHTLPSGALDKSWFVAFTDKEMFDVVSPRMSNVVHYEDPYTLIEAAKKHPLLTSICLHSAITDEEKDIIFHAFPKLEFMQFIGSDANEVKEMNKPAFMSLFRKLPNPYLNAVS